MRRALLLSLLLVSACSKASQTAPEAAAQVEPPADVLLTVSVAHPGAFAKRLARYADTVSPGAGARIDEKTLAMGLAQMVGAPSLEGLDLDKPVWIVVLDPKTHGHPLLVGTFADADKLRRDAGTLKVERDDGRALVGAEADVAAARDWALKSLARQPAPEAPTAEIWIDRVLAKYGADLQAFPKQFAAMGLGGSTQSILQAEVDGIVALGKQSRRLFLVADSTGDTAWLEIAVAARAGTSLESFIHAQKPLDPSLPIPAIDGAAMFMNGHMEIRPFMDGLYDFFGPILAEWSGRPADAAFRKLFDDWFKRFDGNFVAAAKMGLGGPQEMLEVIGVDDGAAAQKAMAALFGDSPRSASMMGMKMTLTPALGVAQRAGASVDGYAVAFDLSTLSEVQRTMQKTIYPPDGTMHMAVAGWGKSLGVSIGPSAVDRLGALIEAKQGATLPAYARSVLDGAAKRKESAAMVMNLAAFTGAGAAATSGIAMTFGFERDRARMRFEVPAAHIVEMMGAIRGRTQ